MPDPALTSAALAGDLEQVFAALPARAGVGQLLDRDGRNLIVGRAANLKRWAAAHLGRAAPRKKGGRPPTDLRPVAGTLAYCVTTSEFHQRLVYERLLARYVPASARRDLKPPVYLHLDPGQRFPRITLRAISDPGRESEFGPFRDRASALRARDGVHKLFPLRPCDYSFEPDPELPLGLGCLYAQLRTCAAPCLARIGEPDYRSLAERAAAFLARPAARAVDWVPDWVGAEAGRRALIAEAARDGIEIYPVRGAAVLEERRACPGGAELETALASLSWHAPEDARDDRAWLAAWLHAPKRRGVALVLDGQEAPAALAERLRAALAQRPASGRGRDRVVT